MLPSASAPPPPEPRNVPYRVVWGPQRFYLSIGWKTLIAFALVVILPMLGLMAITGSTLREAMEDETLHALEANLRGSWRVYRERTDSVRAALTQSAATPEVKRAVKHAEPEYLSGLLMRHAALLPYTDVWLVVDADQRIIARRHGELGERVFLNNTITRAFTFLEPVVSTELIPNRLFLSENPLEYAKLETQVMAQTVVVPVRGEGGVIGALVGLILLNDDDWLPNAIHDYLSIDAALFGSVIQESRIISASTRPNNIWATGLLAPPKLREHIRTGEIYRGKLFINGIPAFIISEPITNLEGLPVGALSIGVRSSQIDQLVQRNARNIYLFTGFGVLLSVVVAYLAYRDTMTPMRAIVRAMDAFARGKLRVRTDIRTKDEFEELGAGFNRMAEAIQEQQERVESFNSLSSLLITSLKPRELMQRVLDKVTELTRSQAGVIYLRDPHDSEGLLLPYVGFATDLERMNPLRSGEGLPGEAALKRKVIHVEDIPEECRLIIDFGVAKSLPSEAALFPLVYRDQTLGVMLLATLNSFRPNELALLEYMSNQIAIVLENALAHEEVERLSITDALTGVHNRGFIGRRVAEELSKAQRYNTPMAVLLLDIDHFKRINDRFGHHAGDEALILVAGCLREHLRETDVVGRYGGEEFLVLLPHSRLMEAMTAAEKLRAAVDRLAIPALGERGVTISVGVAAFPEIEADSADHLIQRADHALYRAKEAGRNRIESAA